MLLTAVHQSKPVACMCVFVCICDRKKLESQSSNYALSISNVLTHRLLLELSLKKKTFHHLTCWRRIWLPMFVSWKPSPVLAFLDEHWSDFYLQVPISVSTFCFSGPLLVGFPKVPFLDLLFSSTGNLTDLNLHQQMRRMVLIYQYWSVTPALLYIILF